MFFKKKFINHNNIAKSLNLFLKIKESPGMICWLSKGLIIFNLLKNLIRKKILFLKYQEINTPCFMNSILWKKSNHWDYYKKYMYKFKFKDNIYALKPMNCPTHIKIFKKNLHSYRELPLRIAEFGVCFRNEPKGALNGLLRLNQFTQDDGHIFCSIKDVKKEIINCINNIFKIYKIFNFNDIIIKLSTRPLNKLGNNNIWDISENILIDILKKNNIKFEFNYNEGAFYGPKIEFLICDKYNRYWQCGTIQLDFNLSKKFNITYINKNNKTEYPIIIHRAILGSIERFIGILLEETQGNLPLWLTPIQVMVINITNFDIKYVLYIYKKLLKNNIRTYINIKDYKLNYKIREFYLQKIPYLIICGKKETLNKTITIKTNNNKNLKKYTLKKFISLLKNDIINYKIKLIGD